MRATLTGLATYYLISTVILLLVDENRPPDTFRQAVLLRIPLTLRSSSSYRQVNIVIQKTKTTPIITNFGVSHVLRLASRVCVRLSIHACLCSHFRSVSHFFYYFLSSTLPLRLGTTFLPITRHTRTANAAQSERNRIVLAGSS